MSVVDRRWRNWAAATAVAAGSLLAGAESPIAGAAQGTRFALTNAEAAPLLEDVGGRFALRAARAVVLAGAAVFADDFEAGSTCHWTTELPTALCYPAGAVVFFAAAACPPGWSELSLARGRAVIGSVSGGTLRGTAGNLLTDLGDPLHRHYLNPSTAYFLDESSGTHSVTGLDASYDWRTFDPTGGDLTVFNWNDGIDSTGSGIYPLAANPPSPWLSTTRAGAHSHTASIYGLTHTSSSSNPRVQLLACRMN